MPMASRAQNAGMWSRDSLREDRLGAAARTGCLFAASGYVAGVFSLLYGLDRLSDGALVWFAGFAPILSFVVSAGLLLTALLGAQLAVRFAASRFDATD
jgi:hypothetical protein